MKKRKRTKIPEKILLVDGDKSFRDRFKNYLSGYRVVETSSAYGALQELHKPNDIDVVVIEALLPDENGIETIKKIREISPEIGTIVLTSHSTEDLAIEAVRSHADYYMIKQRDLDITGEVIEEVLSAKKHSIDFNAENVTDKVERVKHFVEINRYKPVSLRDVAQVVSLSSKYLSRVFEKVSGTRFTAYKLAIKLKDAKRFLCSTHYTVEQIAFKLGYRNSESLIRWFKKTTSFTPTEYRRNFAKRSHHKRHHS